MFSGCGSSDGSGATPSTGTYLAALSDGGTSGDINVPVVIHENTLTIDLSSQMPADFTQLAGGTVHFTDACGQTGFTDNTNQALQIVVNVHDGGVRTFAVSCYANV